MKRDLPAYVYRKGRNRLLYFMRGGVSARMYHEPGTPEFATEYAKHMQGRAIPASRTIAKLAEHYRRSEKWADLSFNTRRSYERHLAYLIEVAGGTDPAALRPVHVNQMRDALRDKPTDANRKISTLSSLLQYGISIGWLDRNPAHGVARLKPTGRTRGPWPVDKIEAFRATAAGRTLLLFELLIGTGQRIGDVLSLRWSDLDADGFTIRQKKTGTEVFVPLTSRLRAVLAATPRRSMFIVCQDNGLPVSYSLAWTNIMNVRNKIGAEAHDIHALRHTAASEIAALPGMTADHVRAITGHSSAAMVRLYAGRAMQKARATEAQKARGTERERNRK